MEGTPFLSMEEQPSSNPRESTTRILAFSLQPKSPSRADQNSQTRKKSSMKGHQLQQARQSLASYTIVENVSDEVKEQADASILMHKESSTGRERLKRHREEVSDRPVMIPDTWGHENLLTDWIDYSSFDKLLAPNGITSAREALIAEGRRACRSHQRLRV